MLMVSFRKHLDQHKSDLVLLSSVKAIPRKVLKLTEVAIPVSFCNCQHLSYYHTYLITIACKMSDVKK